MSKFTEYKDDHNQKCCDKKLTTLEDYFLEDYFEGGSHYWHLECETCKTQYVYDTYERKLRNYPKKITTV